MNLNKLTLGQIKEIKELCFPNDYEKSKIDDDHWVIGKNYLIRTVTMILTGRLVKLTPTEFVLAEAAWVADTGRYTQALANVSFEEVELYPKDKLVPVGRGAFIDGVEISDLPKKQK